jgi:2,4-diketo-3-deoxy-L-fuconate hydrolase
MALEAGDLINAGTSPGVGMGMTPPTYLREGDIVELGISGLGQRHQRIVAADHVAVG